MKLSTHGILAALGAIVLTLLIQSNTAFGTTTAGAPTGLVLALDGNGNDLTVTFSPAASAPHFYEIELHRSASSTGRYSPVAKQGVTASPASFEYQPRKYWYKARGRNCTTAARTTCGAWGSLGTAVEIPTHKSPPPAPSGLTPTSSTATVVNLRWSSLSGAAKYRVEYSDSPDGPWAEAFYELGLTAYRLEALECDTGYYFRISARGDGTTYLDTYGEPSEPAVAARTTSCVTQANRLEAPTGLTVTPDGTVMRLAWTAVTGAVHYKAERSTSTDGPWSTVRFPATAAKRNDHLGLECNTLYYYRVRARGNGSTKSRVFSDPSAVVSNTTASCASITPSVKLVGLAETVSKGSNDSFTVSASNLSATGSYTISVATNSADLAFNSACTLRTKSISRTSQSTPMRVYGCDSTGGEITATLNDGTTAVHKEVAGVAVTRPSMLTVAPTDPLLGQATTLTAIPDSSEGTVLSYVFERIPLDDTVWRDVSALATNPKKAKYADYNTRGNGFRVVIAYSSGKTVTSEVLTASWRPLKVSIEVSEPNLESNLSSNRSATLEAVTPDETFPAGTKFQWYRDEGEGWEQFGTATSSKTKVVSFRTAGTRSYRVRTQHTQMPDGHTISRGASSPVHLTWDEPETLSALLTALDTAVTGNSDYGRDETTLVACMNRVSGPSGSSGNATSTPPLLGGSSGASSNYSNFNGILDDYTGDTKDYMEMSQHCKSNADTMFATFEDVVEDELETLLDDNANYSRMLAAPRWNNFEALISDTDLLKLSAGMKSYAPAGDGAGGTSDENTTTTPRSGVDCLPYSGRDPVDKQERLAVLNCLVFNTPHSYWTSSNSDIKSWIVSGFTRRGDNNSMPAQSWLGYKDWVCTDFLQGPVVSCKKHDVAYNSLQRFSGKNPENDPGGTALGGEIDRTWNARNKILADFKFFADINKHGCQEQWIDSVTSGLCDSPNLAIAFTYLTGVALINNKKWPVTVEHIRHARAAQALLGVSREYGFIDCVPPEPRWTNVEISQTVGDKVSIKWNNEPGCIPHAAVDSATVCVTLYFSRHHRTERCVGNISNTVTGLDIILDNKWNYRVAHTADISIKLYPVRKVYGGSSHNQRLDNVWVRQK